MTHAFVAPIVLALLVAGCGGGGEARGETAGDSARSAQPETSITMSREQVEHGGVRWSTAPSADLTNAIEVPAQVIANEDRTVHVGAPAQGRVISLHVHPGEPIRKGEVLVTLQSPAASNARSDLDKAIAQLAARRAAATYARTARERADRLLEMKAGSRQEAERARADDEAAQAEVRQADAEVARARGLVAQFGSASVTGTMLLRSPLTGIVLSRDIDPGAVAEPGTPLVAVTDPRHLWLLLSVADKVAGTLRSGSRIRFSVPAFPRDTFVARVEGIGGALDTATRMVPVHAVVESGMGRLRPAMFATAWIESGAAQRVVLVPNEAVQFLDERSVVFVARADGKGGARFERRDVTTGAPRGDRTPILSGLGTDDVIVIAGAFAVKSEFSRSKMSGE